MRKEVIYTLKNLYRADMNIYGYHFGKGEKSACIVGACRGNEIQQLYICSQLVRKLKELEERGAIVKNNEILVIPSVNPSSMNISKRFWPTDDTDINRMYPGDPAERRRNGSPPVSSMWRASIIMAYSLRVSTYPVTLYRMCG